MLPSLQQNAQKAAQIPVDAHTGIARPFGTLNSGSMVSGFTRARSCNCIFRYPSPYGWSNGVPFGSPIFCLRTEDCGKLRQAIAENPPSRGRTFRTDAKRAICAPEADSFWRVGKTCANLQQHFFAAGRSWRWSLVGKPQASRPSSARASVRRRRPSLMATFLPARLSLALATSSTAKKTPASVTNQNFPAAPVQPETKSRAIGARSAPVALFVSTTRGLPAGQEPEGT